MIARSPLTALVIANLEGAFTDVLVGHSIAPKNAGWQGEVNADGSNFLPYYVVTPMTATQASGPFDDPSADRQIPYAVASYGVSGEQAEWAADKARAQIYILTKDVLVLGDESYKVSRVSTDLIGAVQRADSMEPPYFGQVDQFVVWLAKQRA